ncbi:MAG: SDR family oxidoreductase [Bacteroidales bacterium]
MDLGLVNKKVLVVGAAKGIGKSIAINFAKEGAIVTAIDIEKLLLVDLNSELHAISDKNHSFYDTDLMNIDITEFAKELINENECFDIVVHNVGGSLVSRDPLASLDEWLYAWRFNAGIAIAMNHILIPPMIEKQWGRVIHISSISSKTLRGNPLYASAKEFLNAYVTTVGRALAPKGVVMTAVMPGAIEFKDSYWKECKTSNPEKYYGFLKEHQAINRFGTPQEVADVVMFLASEKASFMQTSIVAVNGASM